MTSFSRMRISLAVNAFASRIESVLDEGFFLEKWGFIVKVISKRVCLFFYSVEILLSDK